MSLVGFRAKNHPQQIAKRGGMDPRLFDVPDSDESARDNLGTDPVLFARLTGRYHFTLDVCATPENAKCEDYIPLDVGSDGLELSWHGRVWCNPPYSQLGVWVTKAWEEFYAGHVELIVMLVPANRTEQGWWQDLVEPYRDTKAIRFRVEFLRGRQRFVLPGAEAIGADERPPFGCCLLIWIHR